MPRAARIHVPGHVFHVISRCMNREFLIEGETERRRYLAQLAKGLSKTDAKVLAWCVMSSHVHLVLRSGEDPLWRLMKRVNSGYATWRNRRSGRLGPVFADRYRSLLVEEDVCLPELVRYVHLNPVRAGLCQRPEDSDWSSHRSYVGLTPAPEWASFSAVLAMFDSDLSKAQRAFAEYVAEGIGQPRSPFLAGDDWTDIYRKLRSQSELKPSDPILGSEWFVAQIVGKDAAHAGQFRMRKPTSRSPRPPFSALVDIVCKVLDLDRSEFEERPKRRASKVARQLLVRLWVQEYDGTQVELARYLNVSASLVSRWYSRAIERLDENYDLYEQALSALPVGEMIETAEGRQKVSIKGTQQRLSVNIEFFDEQAEIVTPPPKSST